MRRLLLGGLAVAIIIILAISILPTQHTLQSDRYLGGRLSESVEKAQLLLLETPAKLYIKEGDPFASVYVTWFLVTTPYGFPKPWEFPVYQVYLVSRIDPNVNYFQRWMEATDGPSGTKEIKYFTVFRYDAGYTGTPYIVVQLSDDLRFNDQYAFSLPNQAYQAGVNYRWMFYAPSVQYTSSTHNFTGQLFYWKPSGDFQVLADGAWKFTPNWYYLDSNGAQITLTSPEISASYEWSASQLNVSIRIGITSTADVGKNISKIRMYITDPQNNNAFLYNAIILDLASPFIVQGVGDTIVIKVVYNLYPYNY